MKEFAHFDSTRDSNPYGEPVHSRLSPMHTFVQNGPRWIHELRAEPAGSMSYRNFDVRALLLAEMPDKSLYTYRGQNIKLIQDVGKYCAEMFVLDTAHKAGAKRAIGMIVLGTTDTEKIAAVTELSTPTLHPCEACRNQLSGFRDEGFVSDEMPIVTSGLLQADEKRSEVFLDTLELHTVYEKLARYEDLSQAVPELWPDAVEDRNFQGWIGRQGLYAAMMNGQQVHPEVPANISEIEAARMVITGYPGGEAAA